MNAAVLACLAEKGSRSTIDSYFPPLGSITRPSVDTATAAHLLNRRPQTLRGWACNEDGPLRPIRIHGRLAWSVDDIRKVLGVSS